MLINILGILLIGLILWWFFISKSKVKKMETDQPIVIIVKNGIYDPARIQVPAGKTFTLRFLREDATPCAATVLFPQLSISQELPLNQAIDIIITAQPVGEIDFACQMNMYRGKIIIS